MNKLGYTILNMFFEAPEPLSMDDKYELYPWLGLLGGSVTVAILVPLFVTIIG